MPMSQQFKNDLSRHILQINQMAGGSCHVFHEGEIRQKLQLLVDLAKRYDLKNFKEFYAVKAATIPYILRIVREFGFGFDCSSIIEVLESRTANIDVSGPDDDYIMFTSNDTTFDEFDCAANGYGGGTIINLDDVSFLYHPFFKKNGYPKQLFFRINPRDAINKNTAQLQMSGKSAKYGIMYEQVVEAFSKARELGVEKFGLHTMVCSNDLDHKNMVNTVKFLISLVEELEDEAGIIVDAINMGGGIGIPYRSAQEKFDIEALFFKLANLQHSFVARRNRDLAFYMESGRYVTGPHGVLVTRAINRKDIYQTHIGVLDGMIGNPRPAVYGAYHEISVFDGKTGKEKVGGPMEEVNVVGPICEDCDRLTIPGEPRLLPKIHHGESDGDFVVSEDCGAHSISMPSNYNNRPRLPAYIITTNGDIKMVKRRETINDLMRLTKGL